MSGKPLVQAFEQPPALSFVDSWEQIEGDSGRYPEEVLRDPWAEREAMQQLVDLGYVEAPEENAEKAIARHEREAQYYLARVLAGRGKRHEALEILQRLFAEALEETRYGVHLANALLGHGRLTEVRPVFETVREQAILQRKQERQEQRKKAREARRKAIKDSEQKVGPNPELPPLPKLAPLPRKPPAYIDFLEGRLLLAEGDLKGALRRLRRAERTQSNLPRLHLALGDVYLKRRRWRDAERAFSKALEIDPDSAAAYDGLAIVSLRRRWQDAADAALSATGLRYFFPAAHFRLGEALVGLGEREYAAQAYEVCVAQAPGARRARRRLAELYRDHLRQPERAADHLAVIERIEPAP